MEKPSENNNPTGGTGSGVEVALYMVEYDITSSDYSYNSGTGHVIQTNQYATPSIDNTDSLEMQRQDGIINDPQNTNLRDKLTNATSAQIDNWLQNNVTDLASARVVLGAIIKFLANKYPRAGSLE